MPGKRGTLSDRFWPKVKIERMDACWLWTGHFSEDGYGRISTGGRAGRDISASRAAFIIANGFEPRSDQDVCHTCDNPACVNFQHLYLGDRKTNMQDAARRDRISHGEQHFNAKLTEKQARAILSDRRSPYDIAPDYNVSPTTIYDIKRGTTWVRARRNEVK